MWTIPSAGRWIFLLSLMLVVIFSTSGGTKPYVAVHSFYQVNMPCCVNVTTKKVPNIVACYEQNPRLDCNHHAFLVKGKKRTFCISPKAEWLLNRIKKGELKCTSY